MPKDKLKGLVNHGAQAGCSPASEKIGGVDKWQAEDALRTLRQAQEIQRNKPLMKAAKQCAKQQIKDLSSLAARKK